MGNKIMAEEQCISCDVILPEEHIEKGFCWMCRELKRQGAKVGKQEVKVE